MSIATLPMPARGESAAELWAVDSPAPAPRVCRVHGFGQLPCPKCGEDCTIAIDLDEFSACHCAGCDADFDLDEVRSFISRWQRVLTWLETAPGRD